MKMENSIYGSSYFWTSLSGLLLFCCVSVHAQQLNFNPSTIQINTGESSLVAIDLADIPEPGVAAVQVEFHFDPTIINILNPNEEFRDAGIDPFMSLGGNSLCTFVRKTNSCEDPHMFLSSTGRSLVSVDRVDNEKGVIVIGFATRGKQAPPIGNGTIALIKLLGIAEGVASVNVEQNKIAVINNAEPPAKYKDLTIASLSVIVGDSPPLNIPPFLESIGPQRVDEGELLEFNVLASDPDGDSLTLIAANIPEGASFSDNGNGSGKFVWRPDSEAEGEYKLNIKVSDSGIPTEAVSEEVTITVDDVDRDGFPLVPANLAGHVRGARVILRWQGSDSSQYLINRRLEFDNGMNEKEFSFVGQTNKEIYMEKMPDDTVYTEYYIQAENDMGLSDDSQILRIKVKAKSNKK